MANTHSDSRRSPRRRATYNECSDEEAYRRSGEERVALEPELELEIPGVRRIRVERENERSDITYRTVVPTKMTSESSATRLSEKGSSRLSRSRHHTSPKDEVPRRRRIPHSRDESPSAYLYGTPSVTSQRSRVIPSETRRLESEDESSDCESEEEVVRRREPVEDRPKKKKVKAVYVTEEEYHSSKQKERREKTSRDVQREDDSVRRSRTHRTRRSSVAEPAVSPPKRSTSTREIPKSPPVLRRSHTTSSHIPSVKQYAPPMNTTATNASGRRPTSFLNNFFGPTVQQHHHHELERLVECLTCLSDDIPRSKSAKLKCGHRMCQPCLRRIFKLSVTDPQHMPPKCCTADHIPLKHVERLFDNNFKKTWNRKFQEYSTKNRIYCPARRCGEWIKPGNIHKEDGKKFGKCSRCKTKVCCLCNGKWHGNRECPKDEETNKLLAAAKEAGWQRCYSCRTMVELKEGCNHMTCHCTAEFCMCCGLKWKSCNCPWFNYEAVETDRLNHMQIPQPAQDNGIPRPPRDRIRGPRPNTYVEEIGERRRQERLDEEMARRLQNFDMSDDYQGGIGEIHGVGNGAGHFMNQDNIRAAHNILTGTFDQASAAANYVMGVRHARGGPSPPSRRMSERHPVNAPPHGSASSPRAPASPTILRRHTMREEAFAYNNAPSTRASERVVPRRTRTDYASEASVHAPYSRRLDRAVSMQEAPVRVPPPLARHVAARIPEREPPHLKTSVLAGLPSRGNSRVSAWRTYVHPGEEPEEGVLSM